MAGRKKKLTGIEVGRLFIQDLLVEWEAEIEASERGEYREDIKYPGLFTVEQRQAMVDELRGKKEDLSYYALFRSIHDVIMNLPKRYLMFREMTENEISSVTNRIEKIRRAELENNQYNMMPVIMTPKQYEAYQQQKDIAYITGIAVMQEPLPAEGIDSKGNYIQQQPESFTNFCIEKQSDAYGDYVTLSLKKIADLTSELYAMREAARLIGETIGVPEVGPTLNKYQEIDRPIALIQWMNDRIDELVSTIHRYSPDRSIDKEATEAARNMARNTFMPISNIEALKPTEANINKAREYIESDVKRIYSRPEGFHSMISGKIHGYTQAFIRTRRVERVK